MYDKAGRTEPRPIGVQIRSMRVARGWSLAELARRVGTSAPTLHRYEGGWDRFQLTTLRKIASALGARLEVNLIPERGTEREPARPSVGRLLQLISPLFWDRRLHASDLERYQDWVVERVLMFGNWEQVMAMRRFYDDAAVARAIKRRGVDAKTRCFWTTVLDGGVLASEGS
ncbi:MAG: helix-turn-helix domain-containing protein [Acidobacteriota bacterium]